MGPFNITFAGCGYLGIYHIGVISAFQEFSPKLLELTQNFGGCSAGALAAACLVANASMVECAQRVMSIAQFARDTLPFKLGQFFSPLHPKFNIVKTMKNCLRDILPSDSHLLCSGRLHISLTKVESASFENVIVSSFDSIDEIIEALVCTSFVPFYSGIMPPKFKGVAYVDGGFTDNLPQHFSGTTITVSPFSGESDICPDDSNESQTHFDMRNTSVKFTSQNLYRMSRAFFPPAPDVLSDMCRQGFKDALKYLHMHYPEMLNIGIARVHIPACCLDCEVDDDLCVCSSAGSQLTDVESRIAERNTILDTVVPHRLNEILQGTKDLIVECDLMSWYMIRVFLRIIKWLARPCIYTMQHLGCFANEMVLWMIPKVQELSSRNYYTKALVNIALEVFYTYKNKHECERHPSLNEQDLTDMAEANAKIREAQRCMRAVPIEPSQNNNSTEAPVAHKKLTKRKVKPPNMTYLGLSPRKSHSKQNNDNRKTPKEDPCRAALKRQLPAGSDWALKSFSCHDFLYTEFDQSQMLPSDRQDSFDEFVCSFVESEDDGVFSDSSITYT